MDSNLAATPQDSWSDSEKGLERETGIEPATNGLGSRYSTIELLPLASQL